MKKLEVKVETVYTIEVEFEDFKAAKEQWMKEDSIEGIRFKNAFQTTSMTERTLRSEFEEFRPNSDRNGLIAYFLGFDGWKNSLLYYNEKLTMVVYKNGDNLN